MIKQKQIYRCSECGNIVEVLYAGGGELVCCGKPMTLQEENKIDASKEKHVPVIEKTDRGFLIKVGSAPHPMEDNHYIEWIEIMAGGKYCRKFLNPGDAPEAEFQISAEIVEARAYCNLHGLWMS